MLSMKVILSLALLGLCAHKSLGFPESTPYPTTPESETSEAPAEKCQPAAEVRPLGSCYISEVEAAKLSAQLSIWAKILTIRTEGDEEDVETVGGEDKYQLQQTEEGEMTFCSESRIERLEQDLASLVQRVWRMSTSVEDASEEEVAQFADAKVHLIERLSELQVYTMRSSALMTSITFKTQLDLLDHNLDNVLLLFPKSITLIVREILEPGKTTAELVALAEHRPEAMSVALPRLMAAKYAGNLRNFDTAFQLAKSLPSVDLNVQGYATLYEQMRNGSHLESSTWEVTKLALQFFQTPALPASASAAVQAQLTQLTQELESMKPYSSNKTQACSITNVAYSTKLFTTGSSWPEYAAVYSSSSNDNKLWFHPQNGGVTFEIHSGSSLLYSTSGNTVDSYRRYVLEANEMFNVPSGAWKEWILMPAKDGDKYRILNAQNNEVMYVDSSSTVGSGFQRVLLKKPEATVSMRTNADLWSLKCSSF